MQFFNLLTTVGIIQTQINLAVRSPLLNMDDFDEIYLQRHRQFEEGLKKGIQQADAYDMKDIVKEGQQFGQEFVKQLAIYQSFAQTIHHLKISQPDKQPKYHKVQQLINQIENISKQVDYQSLQQLKIQRETMNKKFKLLMTMMGIKKTIQAKTFQIKKTQQALDF